ncbi:DNA-binding protein [Methylobacterium sp.]|uniref:DNA-binding protein n=1 Tax=Methylobacterium sp. TaxID=409 RepID=UPI003B02220F
MELEERVRRAADDLRGKERVTYTAVRERLKRDGERDGKACSYSDLKPILNRWKADTGYLAKIESEASLPEAVQKGLIALGHAILREGEEMARAKLTAQQRDVDQLREMLLHGDDELAMAADRMEGEIERLDAEVKRLHEALARAQQAAVTPEPEAPPSVPPLHTDLDPITAGVATLMDKRAESAKPEDMLADLSLVVHDLLRDKGALGAAEVHYHLPEAIRQRADKLEMPLAAGWLRRWLREFTGPTGGLVEHKGKFDLASRTADAGAAFQARIMADVHALLLDHGFPLAPAALAKRLAPKLGQELRLSGSQIGEWMEGRPDLFRKTNKGWYAATAGG